MLDVFVSTLLPSRPKIALARLELFAYNLEEPLSRGLSKFLVENVQRLMLNESTLQLRPEMSNRSKLKELELLFDQSDTFEDLANIVTPFTSIEMLKLLLDQDRFADAVRLAELVSQNSDQFKELQLWQTDRMFDF